MESEDSESVVEGVSRPVCGLEFVRGTEGRGGCGGGIPFGKAA